MNVIVANGRSLAFEDQLKQIIKLTKNMTHELGYVMPVMYRQQAEKKSLLLLMAGNTVAGFCAFNIRKKDGVAIIYEIATHPGIRGKGGGLMLVNEVLNRAEVIQLKCPIDNKSNGFYDKIGEKIKVEDAKKRKLNVWQITNKTVRERNE